MSKDKATKEQNQCLGLQKTSGSENRQIKETRQVDKREEIINCSKLLDASHFRVRKSIKSLFH